MKVIVSQGRDLTNIVVDNLDTKSSIKEFLKAIQYRKNYEISFFNIKTLPFEVLVRLNSLKELVSIEVNEAILKYYLQNLGFKVKLVNMFFKNSKQIFDKIVIRRKQ